MDRIKPHDKSNLNNLLRSDPLLKLTERKDIKLIIKTMKDKELRESGLRKTILEQIPDARLDVLNNILNHSLSMGYFPDDFKNAMLCMISKMGKNTKDAQNYRPISLI